MIIKGLDDRIKTVILKQEIDGVIQEIPVDKVVGEDVYLIEIDDVYTFRELISPKTNKPYKNKALLRTVDGWIKVKHSMEELQRFKQTLHKKIEIKGFRK